MNTQQEKQYIPLAKEPMLDDTDYLLLWRQYLADTMRLVEERLLERGAITKRLCQPPPSRRIR